MTFKRLFISILIASFYFPLWAQAQVNIEEYVVDTAYTEWVDTAYTEEDYEAFNEQLDSATMRLAIIQSITELLGNDIDTSLLFNDIENFYQNSIKRHDLKASVPITMYVTKMQLTGEKGPQNANPELWRALYSSILEHTLLKQMGGTDNDTGIMLQAFKAVMGELFSHNIPKEPEAYCAQADSVAEYIRQLDYIGSIYPEQKGLKPAKEQEIEVKGIIEIIEKLKAKIREHTIIATTFRKLIKELYSNPSTANLAAYFTPELLDKVKKDSLDMKIITPPSDWKDWDADNIDLCNFSAYEGTTYTAFLTRKKFEELTENISENDKEEEFKEKHLRLFNITFEKIGDTWLINNFAPFEFPSSPFIELEK